jgi:hypothetical protein
VKIKSPFGERVGASANLSFVKSAEFIGLGSLAIIIPSFTIYIKNCEVKLQKTRFYIN